jgi:hypothetical protein
VSSVVFNRDTAPLPGFFRTLWELIVGYLFALIGLGIPVIALIVLGVFDWHSSSRHWPLRGPFTPEGVWAISADVFCAIVVVGVSALIIAGSIQATVRLPVSRLAVAAVIALTGVAPFLFVHLLPVTGPASLLLAAFLIRALAIDRFAPIRPRLPRWSALAAIGAAVAGLASTIGFGVTHPLWPNSVNVNNRQVSFILRNAGFADVEIIRISASARAGFGPWQEKPVEGMVVPARGSRWITLRERGCPPADLTVRYRLFGRTMSAPLRPNPLPAELRC